MNIKEYEEFIDDLVEHFDEFTTSDLEGVVMAKCFKKEKSLGENAMEMDAILDEIYKRVDKRG